MSDRRERARVTLARFGVSLTAFAAEGRLPPVLEDALTTADGIEVAEALGEVGTAETALALTERLARLPDAAVRKAVRRALFRLGQRGIPLPPPTHVAPPRPAPAPAIEGFVSAPDGRGDRIVWLIRPLTGGGVMAAAAELNEPEGLRRVRLFETTRRALREMRARFEREGGLVLVAADWRALDALLVEGQNRNPAADPGSDWRRLRTRFTSEAPAAPAELHSARVTPPSDAEVPALAAAAPALLEEPEFRSWWPSEEALRPFLEDFATIRESPLVLSPAQQQERVRTVLERAAATLFPPASTARRLEATAFVLAERGRLIAARQALATARALRERGTLGPPVPLVAALVQAAIAARYAELQTARGSARRDALVVAPGQTATSRSPFRRTRTPG